MLLIKVVRCKVTKLFIFSADFFLLVFFYLIPEPCVLYPYFLRNYDRRWYVGGFSQYQGEKFVRTFPLERMVGLPDFKGFFHDKPKDFDATSYWKHIYGITIPPNAKVETVDLEFTALQGKYFLSTPFFEPFEIVNQTPKSLIIRFQLIPNIDLERKIGSLGSSVKVLQPKHLVNTMRDFHKKANQQYQ